MIRSLVGGLLATVLLVLPAANVFAQGTACAQPTASARQCFPGPIRLLLPPHIYAVPGIEMNVYFDNVCLVVNRANYVFDVCCAKGVQQAERWTLVPTKEDVGQYPLTLEVRDETNQVIARTATILHVVPQDAGADVPISFLTIGASETHAMV
jgi:hypothetical protein